MANFDRIVNVQIALNTTGISKLGFSTVMVIGKHTHGTSRVLTYTDTDQLVDDGFQTTDAIYKAVSACFSQIPSPTQVKVGKWNSEEDLPTALAAIRSEDDDFYGIVLADRTEANVLAMAEWTETHMKLFMTATGDDKAKDASSTTDIMAQLQSKNYYRTAAWYHANATDEYPEAAVMARCFAIDPGGETWANKKLAAITADNLTETEYNAITKKNGNTFEKFRNVSITQNGKVAAGEWIDVIRFRDWLQEEIRTNEFYLLINSDKVPYTDVGIAMVETVLRKALEDGQAAGGIAPTEYDEDGNKNLGYTIDVPLSSSITANQKASRVLKDVKFTARLAGAIHAIRINGSFTYDNLLESA